jgi:cyanamide hydratase
MKLFAATSLLNSILITSVMAHSKPADHSPETIKKFGWSSVPHAQSTLLKDVNPWDPANFTTSEIEIPNSQLAKKTMQYAQEHLPEQAFNHSMRVFYYG